MYSKFFKRFFDFCLSLIGITVLSPLFIVLSLIGAIIMKGNPFFVQKRPGMIDKKTGKERIISLIKFRSMTNEKDKDGNLLPDERRLVPYGKFLRKTSLDELPSLLNVIVGDLALVGPRPLLVRYLPRYSERQHHRHDVRPGITGYAQSHGRNTVSWGDKFEMDLWYVSHVSLKVDLSILLKTVTVVLKHEGINSATSATMEEFMGSENDMAVSWEAPQ